MRFLILFLYLAWGFQAAAAVYDSSQSAEFDRLIAQGGFFRPEETPIVPNNFERATKASVRLPSMGTCSAVILSNDGYIATALHCVTDCLRESWDYKPDIKVSRLVNDGVYKALGIQEQTAPRLNCPAMHSSDYWIWDFGLSEAKVVWIGSGTVNNNESRLAGITPEEFAKVKDLNEDVVILKYDHRETKSLPCVPTVKAPPAANEPVWAIGFPVRGPGFVHTGYNEFVSLGRVRASIGEDPLFKKYEAALDPQNVSTFWRYQRELWDKPSMLLTSLDASTGNSGGMIMNQEGELAAILFTIMKIDPVYNGSTVIGVSLPYIKEQISKSLGAEKANEVFHCEEPTRLSQSASN